MQTIYFQGIYDSCYVSVSATLPIWGMAWVTGPLLDSFMIDMIPSWPATTLALSYVVQWMAQYTCEFVIDSIIDKSTYYETTMPGISTLLVKDNEIVLRSHFALGLSLAVSFSFKFLSKYYSQRSFKKLIEQ